ncbi:MAG: hypothetical protein ACXADY_13080 [Candidatus Hodarchaeales archaeon]|jgi:hypothetical protein
MEGGYDLKITNEGNSLGKFHIKPSRDLLFDKYVYLQFEKEQNKFFVGYFLNNTGEFTFFPSNKEYIQQYGIKQDEHFRIVKLNHSKANTTHAQR